MSLPTELSLEIYKYCNFGEKISLAKTFKEINNFHKEYITSFCIKIQRWYRKNRITEDYICQLEEDGFGFRYIPSKKLKKYLIRLYIAVYPLEHLYNYPEFTVWKFSQWGTSRPALVNWANNNPDKSIRTRRMVKEFLELCSWNDMTAIGW